MEEKKPLTLEEQKTRELFDASESIRKQIFDACQGENGLDADKLMAHLVAHISIQIMKVRYLEQEFKTLERNFQKLFSKPEIVPSLTDEAQSEKGLGTSDQLKKGSRSNRRPTAPKAP